MSPACNSIFDSKYYTNHVSPCLSNYSNINPLPLKNQNARLPSHELIIKSIESTHWNYIFEKILVAINADLLDYLSFIPICRHPGLLNPHLITPGQANFQFLQQQL